jgi:hypothetical protein
MMIEESRKKMEMILRKVIKRGRGFIVGLFFWMKERGKRRIWEDINRIYLVGVVG